MPGDKLKDSPVPITQDLTLQLNTIQGALGALMRSLGCVVLCSHHAAIFRMHSSSAGFINALRSSMSHAVGR